MSGSRSCSPSLSHAHAHAHAHSLSDPDSSPVSCLSLSMARKRFRRLFSIRRSHTHNGNDEQVPLAPLPPLQYAIHELGPLLHPSPIATTSPAQVTLAPTNHQPSHHQSAPPSLKSILVHSASRHSHTPLPPSSEPPRHTPPAAGRPPVSSFSSTSDSSTSDLAAALSAASTLPTTATATADSSNTAARGSTDSGLAPSVTSAALAASDALALAVRTVLSDPTLPSLDHRVSPSSTAAKRKSVRIDLEPAIGCAPKYDRSPDPANLSERLRHGRVTAAEHRRVLDEVLVLKKVARESYRQALGSANGVHPPPSAEAAAAAVLSMSLSEALAGSVSDTRDVVGALVATLADFVVKATPATALGAAGPGRSADGHGMNDEHVDLGRDREQLGIPGHYPTSPTLAIAQRLYPSPVPSPATPAASAPSSSPTTLRH